MGDVETNCPYVLHIVSDFFVLLPGPGAPEYLATMQCKFRPLMLCRFLTKCGNKKTPRSSDLGVYHYQTDYLKNSRASSMNRMSRARLTPVASASDTVTMSIPRRATILPQSPCNTSRAA